MTLIGIRFTSIKRDLALHGRVLLLVFVLANFGAITAAFASTPSLYYATEGYPGRFFAMITGMPDLDQIRKEIPIVGKSGLPADGAVYCAPTAVADIFGFLAVNGYPEIVPMNDPDTWDDRTIPGDNDATSLIRYLGTEMGTDGDGAGTDFDRVATVMRRELNRGRERGNRFRVKGVADFGCFPSSEDADTSVERLWAEIANGNLVYGNLDYYVADGSRPGFSEISWSHAIVITGAMRVGGRDFITVVEPSSRSSDSPYLQGEYRTHTYEVERNSFDLSDGACRRTLTEVIKEDGLGLGTRPVLSGLLVVVPPAPYDGSVPLGFP